MYTNKIKHKIKTSKVLILFIITRKHHISRSHIPIKSENQYEKAKRNWNIGNPSEVILDSDKNLTENGQNFNNGFFDPAWPLKCLLEMYQGCRAILWLSSRSDLWSSRRWSFPGRARTDLVGNEVRSEVKDQGVCIKSFLNYLYCCFSSFNLDISLLILFALNHS